ncbi:hypothetical protein HmCmsJML176_02623 [Escherichia coli]|nr:hypothetical protein HmCmsJML176_02623 [Escherichia coli]
MPFASHDTAVLNSLVKRKEPLSEISLPINVIIGNSAIAPPIPTCTITPRARVTSRQVFTDEG